MTGTFTEDTEFSATAATRDQTLTMVAGQKTIGSGVQQQTQIGYLANTTGSLSSDKIFYNGVEYTITGFTSMRSSIVVGSIKTLVFSVEPPFSEITFDIDGTEATYGRNNINRKMYISDNPPEFVDGTTYTIKVVSIE